MLSSIVPFRKGGFGGVTPETILKFYIKNGAFWSILTDHKLLSITVLHFEKSKMALIALKDHTDCSIVAVLS